VYTKVTDPDNLRQAMGSFYDFFSKSDHDNQPVITVPYYDAFGLGRPSSFPSTALDSLAPSALQDW
jgi:hypothetical protein